MTHCNYDKIPTNFESFAFSYNVKPEVDLWMEPVVVLTVEMPVHSLFLWAEGERDVVFECVKLVKC